MINLFDIILYFISYLLGSIPFGYIIAKYISGHDIRKHGSGNIGATNITRVHGKKIGILTLFLDTSKAFIALSLVDKLGGNVELAAIICILGHIFPIWLNFNGGKGVATILGALLFIDPFLALIFIISWSTIFFIGKTASIASIFSVIIILLVSNYIDLERNILYMIIAMLVITIFTHRENIYRIIYKQELKIRL
jgi:glycerol-3-phosphate acyltransferase PlsY